MREETEKLKTARIENNTEKKLKEIEVLVENKRKLKVEGKEAKTRRNDEKILG